MKTAVLCLFLLSVALAYRVENGTIIPDVKEVDGRLMMDVDIEGGIETADGTVNATVVYGRFPNAKKRQSTPLATFYQNSNGGGTSWTATLPTLLYPGGIPYLTDKVTSIDLLDMNYILHVYTGFDYSGTCWSFRSPIRIYNLADYGINDAISSIRFVYVGSDYGAVILYQHGNYAGKSIYVPGSTTTTYYPNIQTTASISGMCGVMGNDMVSSLILLKWSATTLYRDGNFGGTFINYGISHSDYEYVPSMGSYSDWVSSLEVVRYA